MQHGPMWASDTTHAAVHTTENVTLQDNGHVMHITLLGHADSTHQCLIIHSPLLDHAAQHRIVHHWTQQSAIPAHVHSNHSNLLHSVLHSVVTHPPWAQVPIQVPVLICYTLHKGSAPHAPRRNRHSCKNTTSSKTHRKALPRILTLDWLYTDTWYGMCTQYLYLP